MICTDCGAETPRLLDGSCPACFTQRTPLLQVPEVLDVELCSHCDARHVGAHWADAKDMPIDWIREDAVREAVRVHGLVEEPYLDFSEEAQDDKHFLIHVRLEGRIESVEVQANASVLVRTKQGVCDRCSRMFGNYYAAIIQLRATERDVAAPETERAHQTVRDELLRQQNTGNRFAFLSKDGPMHGGWDYYVGDIEAARGVCRVLKQRLGASVQESAKLVGRREGDDVYRVTFLVRIRRFAPGDFAVVDGARPVQIVSVERGKAVAWDLVQDHRTKVDETRLKRLGGREVLEDAVVVSQEPSGLQLLDPQDYRTREVLVPPGWQAQTDTVPVLRVGNELYIVPTTQGH